MVLQTKIPLLGSNAAINYDATDLASGLGYEDFYFCVSEEGGVKNFNLVNQTYKSIQQEISLGGGSEENMDSSPFNQTRTVAGTLYISGSVHGDDGSAPSSFTFRLLKVSGSTETVISTNPVVWESPAATPENIFLAMPLDETSINPGEFLRFEVVGATQSNDLQIGSDPQDGDGSNIQPSTQEVTTITKISIPFRIYS